MFTDIAIVLVSEAFLGAFALVITLGAVALVAGSGKKVATFEEMQALIARDSS